jgi:hypothetical protein
MTERIYGKDFDEDPNTKEDNTSIRFNEETLYVNFSHYAGILNRTDFKVRARTSFIVRQGEALYPGLHLIQKEDASVLPKVIEQLQGYREELELPDTDSQLLDYAISGLQEIVDPKEDAQTGDVEVFHPLTRRPHPRTSTEYVDVRWFEIFKPKK